LLDKLTEGKEKTRHRRKTKAAGFIGEASSDALKRKSESRERGEAYTFGFSRLKAEAFSPVFCKMEESGKLPSSDGEVIPMAKYIEDTNIQYVPDTPGNRKVLKEVEAYDAMWQDLLKTHEGKFVAIHNGEVVDCDDNDKALLRRVLGKYKPVYVEQVLNTRYREYLFPDIDRINLNEQRYIIDIHDV